MASSPPPATAGRAEKLADRARSEEALRKLAQFEERTRLLLVLSAILPIVVAFSRATTDSGVSIAVNIVSWIVFVVDLLVHMRYIRHYLRTGTGVFDLVVVILTAPWFLIPGFGGTQFLQLARLARLLRIIAVSPAAKQIAQRLGQVGIFAVGMLLFSSWAAYIAEHPTNPGFATFGNALWWGIVTLTTVGYGDIVPKTTTGRVAGVFLMLTGVATLGIISGTLASFFKSAREEEAAAAETAASAAAAGIGGGRGHRAERRAGSARGARIAAGSGVRHGQRRHELTETLERAAELVRGGSAVPDHQPRTTRRVAVRTQRMEADADRSARASSSSSRLGGPSSSTVPCRPADTPLMVIHGACVRSVAITSSRRRRYADAHLSEVSIEVTCRDEVGECRLVDRRHADAPAARLRHRLDERGRQHEPCDVQTRRERLARSASVDDTTRVETLHRTNRLAVVAELTVVVVLDDPTIAPSRPLDERDSPCRRHRHSEGILVRGRHERRTRSSAVEDVDSQSVVIDRNPRDRKAGTCAELGMEGERGVFDRDRVETGGAQRLREHAQCLGEATEDDDVLRIGANRAGTAEIRRKSDAELAQATWVAVAEEVVGRGAEHAADRCRPLASRERPAVGLARPEVGVVAPSLDRRARRCGFRSETRCRGHVGAGPADGDEQSLRGELLVGAHHGRSGTTQLGCERSRRRQPDTLRQLPGRHGAAEGVFEPGLAAVAVRRHEQEVQQSGLLRLSTQVV